MMLTQLTALRGALANGGNVHECQAALIAVTDELKRLLTPPEQTQETDKAEQSSRKIDPREERLRPRSRAAKERYLSGSALRIIKARAAYAAAHQEQTSISQETFYQ